MHWKKIGLGLWLWSALGTLPATAQHVPAIRFEQLRQRIDRPNDTLYVINFWATWCAPCVKELPQFEQLYKTRAGQRIQVLLVSMDQPATLTTKVIPFVRSRKLQTPVILLNEPELDSWVDKLVPEWSGALPMTLLLNKRRNVRRFIGNELKNGELASLINQYNQ